MADEFCSTTKLLLQQESKKINDLILICILKWEIYRLKFNSQTINQAVLLTWHIWYYGIIYLFNNY